MSLRPRRWPLRRRMTAAMVVLLVVVVAVVGGISLAVQRGALMLRMDEQLQSDLHMMEGALDDPGGAASADGPDGDADGRSPRPRVDSLHVVEQADGTRTAELVDASGEVEELDAAAVEEILAASAEEAATVDLGDHGGYRVLSASAAEELDGGPQVDDGAQGPEEDGRQEDGPEEDGEVLAVGQSMDEVERTSRDMLLIFSGVALIAVLAATLLARLLAVAGLRPLDRLAATASEVGRTPLASGTVSLRHRVAAEDADPATEVGQVGAAFNQMLDHVESSLQLRQQSEERLRRFIADAGHELRTPLAAISGHLQLSLRRGDQLPEDVARSLERVDAETGRMGTLVEDLLLLARLDVGQRLAREPVDVARVVVDACSDAQVTGPEHQWLIELPDDAADLQVTGDADRLHQVLTNLLANARAHTPAGTTVTVRLLHPRRDAVIIEVEDDGPGIPDELRPRIFDRFVRGDDARSRSAGSTGLGMSIAAAIVHAHDGDLTVGSRPGRTCFRARLPTTATRSAETGSTEACFEETRADAPDDADRS